jgi:galactonate dehydratase
MRITDVKVYLVEGSHERLRWIFVHVYTDEGLVGLGDATNWPHGEIIVKAIQCLREHVVGESPYDIERLWKKMYGALVPLGYGGVQVSAICGIESACWDIIGKATGQPIYNLIGGRMRERLRLFAICGLYRDRDDMTPMQKHVAGAQWVVDQGFTAYKWSPKGRELTPEYIREVRETGHRLREVMGPDRGLSVDLGNVRAIGEAIPYAQAAAECQPMYMEFHAPENIEALVKLNREVKAPIAIGEHQWARYGFREAFERHAVEVINLDVVRTGGILEARKIAAMAEAYYVQVAPHNPNSPISTLVSAHASIGMPNFMVLEFIATDAPWRDEIMDPPLRVEDGYLIPPEAPGLGAELNMDVVRQHAIEV